MQDGILHVKNTATPAEGVETMELEELWRIGGDDEESVLLGLIAQALVDDDNNIYLLDSQLNHIEVFSSTGEHLKTLGREGTGPGEFNMAFDMVFTPDGNIGVAQVFPGKLIKLDLEGDPAGVYQPMLGEAIEGGFLALVNSLSAGGNLVLSGIDISMDQQALTQTRTYFVKSFGEDGKPVADYYSEERVWDFNNFTLRERESDFVWSRIDVGPDGKVVIGTDPGAYTMTVYHPDGQIDRVIEREYTSLKRNEKAKARATARLEGQVRQFPPGTPFEVEDMEPDVEGLYVRDDGSIWVLTSRAMWEPKPDVFQTFDVFSPAGDFVKQVDFKVDGTSWSDLLIFAKGDLVFQITGFFDAINAMVGGVSSDSEEEPEPMEVICYRAKLGGEVASGS
jgi:hypothetical protein